MSAGWRDPSRLGNAAALLLLAACGRGGAVVRGNFADTALAADTALVVRVGGVPEAAKRTEGGFLFRRPRPGRMMLEARRGGTPLGLLSLDSVPAGARVELRDLAVDPTSALLFPRAVALRGMPLIVVNGIRMAEPGRLADSADVAGTLLARNDSASALLVRPADAALPDLRVVVSPSTETVTADGDPVPITRLREDDSVRVSGTTDGAYLLASRVVVPRGRAVEETPEEHGERDEDEPAAVAAEPTAAEPSVRAVPERRARSAPASGRGRPKMRGGGRGRGKRD